MPQLPDHLRRVSHTVLPGPRRPQLDQLLLDRDQLRVQVRYALEHGARILPLLHHRSQVVQLPPDPLDPVDRVRRLVVVGAQRQHHLGLRRDVRLRPVGVRILQHGQRRRPALHAVDLQRDRVAPRRHHHGDPAATDPHPVRPQVDPVRVERCGAHPHLARVLVAQVPLHAVDAGGGGAAQRAHHFTRPVRHPHRHLAGPVRAQPVVDRCAVGRVRPLAHVDVGGLGAGAIVEAVRVAGLEEVNVGRGHGVGHLLERRDVVHDPEAAPVRSDDQVIEMLLHDEAVHGRRREVVPEQLPCVAVVERDVDAVLGPQEDESVTDGVLVDASSERQWMILDPLHNLRPALSIVAGAVDVGPEVADLMVFDRQKRLAGLMAGDVDPAHDAVRGQIGDVVGDVRPRRAAVPADVHQAVVGTGHEDAGLDRRLVEGVDHAAVLDADVVRGEPAADSLARLVVGGEVGADLLPALAAVGGAVHVLAGDVERVAVVGRDQQREGPLEAVPELFRRPSAGALGPHLDVAELAVALVVADHDAASGARPRRAGPHDVRVLGVRRGESALAAAHRMPVAARDRAAPEAAVEAVRRPAEARPVLPVPKDVVRNRVVDGDVVHLRHRQLGAEPRDAAVDRDRDALVVAHQPAVGVGGVDPEVVIVAAGARTPLQRRARAPAVNRACEGRREEHRLVGIVGEHAAVVVVAGAAAEVAVVRHELPRGTAVVGTPELARVGRLSLPRHPVTGLDQRVDPVRVRGRHAQADLAHRTGRQPAPFELRPGVARIAAHVDAA